MCSWEIIVLFMAILFVNCTNNKLNSPTCPWSYEAVFMFTKTEYWLGYTITMDY